MNPGAFSAKCIAYGEAAKIKKGKFPVIDRRENPREWQAWERWYLINGLPSSARTMRETNVTRWTVPTMVPSAFEAFVATGAI
jgi:hypothetical protein